MLVRVRNWIFRGALKGRNQTYPISLRVTMNSNVTLLVDRSSSKANCTAYKNRNLVHAKLSDHDYFEMIRYCKKFDLNINKFIKLSIKSFLYHV